jgi:MFS transporter, LPLT family, lysophospholipid transporter
VYVLAAVFNLRIPDTGARYPHQQRNPIKLVHEFWQCNLTLWRDKLGQISLAITTLIWGAGATLQFIVLDWASAQLGLPLSSATQLQGVVAVGIAVGSIVAARMVRLRSSVRILPVGIALGLLIPMMTLVTSQSLAFPMLALIGALAGFFVVPMNALLQHRGHVLMSAGHSIAVQNFNENLSILVMLLIYSVLVKSGLSVNFVIVMFGLFVAAIMALVRRRHQMNQARFDTESLIADDAHH